MNLLEIIADVIEQPEGAHERMLGWGVSQDVIDAVMQLTNTAVAITDDFAPTPKNNWTRTITFTVR